MITNTWKKRITTTKFDIASSLPFRLFDDDDAAVVTVTVAAAAAAAYALHFTSPHCTYTILILLHMHTERLFSFSVAQLRC